MELLRALAAIEPNYLRMAVAGVVLSLAIVTPIELFKYVKDAYYFDTFNWHTQWKCRVTTRLLKYSMLYHMTLCVDDDGHNDEYTNKRKQQCVEVMRLAQIIILNPTINRRVAYSELISYVNNDGLYGILMAHEDSAGIYSKYGIW